MKLPEHYVPVEDNQNLVRDTRSNAIININVEAHRGHKAARDRQRMIDKTIEDVADLKSQMSSIEKLLEKVLDKLS